MLDSLYYISYADLQGKKCELIYPAPSKSVLVALIEDNFGLSSVFHIRKG